MQGKEFRAIRQSYGWSAQMVAAALSYGRKTVSEWERLDRPIPPDAERWLKTLPALRSAGRYAGDRRGLRAFMHQHQYTIQELALVIPVSPTSIHCWVTDRSRIPDIVARWLECGAPSDWLWFPPGYDSRGRSITGFSLKEQVYKPPTLGLMRQMYPSGTGEGFRWRRVGEVPREQRKLRAGVCRAGRGAKGAGQRPRRAGT